MAKKVTLNEAVAAKFKLQGKPVSNKFIDKTYGLIDFREMSLKQAENLVKARFPYLVVKKSTGG